MRGDYILRLQTTYDREACMKPIQNIGDQTTIAKQQSSRLSRILLRQPPPVRCGDIRIRFPTISGPARQGGICSYDLKSLGRIETIR